MQILQQITSTVNKGFSMIESQPVLFSFIELFIILYGAYAVPDLPLAVSKHLGNSWVRLAVLAVALAVAQVRPSLAVIIATVYMVGLHFMTKKAVTEIAKFGVVTPETSIVISGGDGPSIKPTVVVVAEQQQMNKSVQEGAFNVSQGVISDVQSEVSNLAPAHQASNLPSYNVEPEAMLDFSSAAAVDGLPDTLPKVPADMPASDVGMTAPDVVDIPAPFESVSQETLAELAL